MKLSKCENGHFYDSDKYPECPYCNPALKNDSGILQAQAAAAPEAAASGPVSGWLVVVEGPGRGRDLRLGAGKNFLGTGADGAPCLLSADAALSARIAAVAYDPGTAASRWCPARPPSCATATAKTCSPRGRWPGATP